MQAETPRILPLPAEDAAQLKSSTAIPSLEYVVVGLVENALDASARQIEVNVDFRHGSCSVEDNGCGILPIEFSAPGGLGKPSCMSSFLLSSQLLISDLIRHLKVRTFSCSARRSGDFLSFLSCTVGFDVDLPPSCS